MVLLPNFDYFELTLDLELVADLSLSLREIIIDWGRDESRSSCLGGREGSNVFCGCGQDVSQTFSSCCAGTLSSQKSGLAHFVQFHILGLLLAALKLLWQVDRFSFTTEFFMRNGSWVVQSEAFQVFHDVWMNLAESLSLTLQKCFFVTWRHLNLKIKSSTFLWFWRFVTTDCKHAKELGNFLRCWLMHMGWPDSNILWSSLLWLMVNILYLNSLTCQVNCIFITGQTLRSHRLRVWLFNVVNFFHVWL